MTMLRQGIVEELEVDIRCRPFVSTTCSPWNGAVPAFRASSVDCSETRRPAADVERPRRQLRAELANGLRRDDADRLPQLDHLPGRQVAAAALRAHAAAVRGNRAFERTMGACG